MNHQEIIELLPWYVNATLSSEEKAIVASHLEGCAECAGEVRSLTAIRKAAIAVGDQAPDPSPFLLNRAMAEIESYERQRAQAEGRPAPKPRNFRDRVRAFRENWWPATPVFARFAMATQLALLLAVGTVALYQYNHPRVVRESTYGTAAGPSGTPGTEAKAKISVAFNEKASAREIRQTLSEINGTIVDGPSAQGFYTVQLPFAPEQTTEVDKVVQKLQQNRRVVSFAATKQ